MSELLGIFLAVVSVVVSFSAALWEFVLQGRKRLGFRVQMDTTAEEVRHKHKDVWENLSSDGKELKAPSFVLLRIENNGRSYIDENDYGTPTRDLTGIEVRFPERRIAGVMITEINGPTVHRAFMENDSYISGLNVKKEESLVELPKVQMNRGEHYKVLVALEGIGAPPKPPKKYPDPVVRASVKGGRFRETKYRSGPSKFTMALIGFLVAVIVAQLVLSLTDEQAPLDCASGELNLVGSTAFEPVVREAADAYRASCPDVIFEFDFGGSRDGLETLNSNGAEGRPMLAFSDGAKPDGMPMLAQRSIALSVFTFVVNREAGMTNLSTDQVRQLYAGEITNWRQVEGNDVPVILVGREPGSGSRRTVEDRILQGPPEIEPNSEDCQNLDSGIVPDVIRCERPSTSDVLATVASTPGALGYSALGAVLARDDLVPVSIDGRRATLDAEDQEAYPLWQTEFAYTYGEPEADSLTASFLRYLTSGIGRDIIRSHSHRPCAELDDPVRCSPVPE